MKPIPLRTVLLAAIASCGAYVLLAPPIVGLADQGDFGRTMERFGIAYPAALTLAEQSWCFADVTYRLTGSRNTHYVSSHFLFVGAAVALNRLLGNAHTFDIRFLSLAELAALLCFFYCLGGSIQGIRGATRYGRAAGLVFAAVVVTDAGYLAYLNSFYSEAASFVFGVAFAAFLFRALERPTAGNVCLLAATAALLATAKPQNAPLGLVAGGFFLAMPLLRREWRALRGVSAASAAVVMAAGLSIGLSAPEWMRRPTLYATVFTGVLPDSDHPASDLAELGIDPRAEIYAGTSLYSPNSQGAGAYFPGRCSLARVVRYYLAHPGYLARRTNRVVRAALSNRYHTLGNYQRGTGHQCLEQARFPALWDPLRAKCNSLTAAGGFLLATLAGALFLAVRRGAAAGYGYALLVAMAGAAFFTAAIGDGADYRKHLFLFHLLFDGCVGGTLIFAVSQAPRVGRWRRAGGGRPWRGAAAVAVVLALVGGLAAIEKWNPPLAAQPVPYGPPSHIRLANCRVLNTPMPLEVGFGTATSNYADVAGLTGAVAGAALPAGDYIFAHANSRLVYRLNSQGWPGWNELSFSMGLDDAGGADAGSVVYVVKGDGRVLYRSPVVRAMMRSERVAVDLRGVGALELMVTDAGDGIVSDEAYWIAPRLR